ncbi:MAG: hypothetical protein JXR23_10255 [Pontiellaceae bacterium]|nr:hypothetical protein [Pontiellaceae bacterium]
MPGQIEQQVLEAVLDARLGRIKLPCLKHTARIRLFHEAQPFDYGDYAALIRRMNLNRMVDKRRLKTMLKGF